jgi:hypothetical protein
MTSSCVPVCASGIKKREKRAGDNADLHHGLAAEAVGNGGGHEGTHHDEEDGRCHQPANLLGGQMQRFLGQHQQRAAERQVVALDEADRPEHKDDLQMVSAERNAVELAAEQKAGRLTRGGERRGLRHGVLPNGQPGETASS